MPTELFSPLMTAREARLKTPLALAYVGDTVWDLLVRRSLLRSGEKAGALHRKAVQLVNAAAQARASRSNVSAYRLCRWPTSFSKIPKASR